MKAIILSAGQGRRLLPLTAERPKCLVPICGKPLLHWQLEALAEAGIREIAVVVGFMAEKVEAALAGYDGGELRARALLNPFFNVADNLGSCFLARPEMTSDFLIVNGDTLFAPDLLARVLASPAAPVTVTIDRKPSYDSDDMKVRLDGDRVVDIGKTLDPKTVDGEAIGLHAFRGSGPKLFRDAVERAMRTPEGLKVWYPSVIARLAAVGEVRACSIEGLSWGEVDFPSDLARAEEVARGWAPLARPGTALAG